jgi:hypothetical protein
MFLAMAAGIEIKLWTVMPKKRRSRINQRLKLSGATILVFRASTFGSRE